MTQYVQVTLSPELSVTSQEGHIIDNLTTGFLISIGKLYGYDCIAIFTKYHVKTIKYGNLIILNHRNCANGLWNIPIAFKASTSLTSQKHLAHSALSSKNTKLHPAYFLHGAAFNPI